MPGGALLVQCRLEDEHGGRLVDDRAMLTTLEAAVPQCTVGIDRRESLVDETDGHGGDPLCKGKSILTDPVGGGTFLPRE